MRVIAGQYASHKGPAKTATRLRSCDLRLRAGKRLTVRLCNEFTCALVLLNGEVRLNGADTLREANLALLDEQGSDLLLEASQDSKITHFERATSPRADVGRGAFVNSEAVLEQATKDFEATGFGLIHQ